ncbi:MAG: hypothetical protein LAT77_10055 [Aliidiomarina sp.]|uniref:hypothetical protein n=1 Tax=Aliidiomarina sp. TaxID=1872439 RepID=UPI0025BF5FD5|nr:hypothetical protein [Aliidiomarina sp.]MCH8502236.1 hypothetical protein [Aliidiomarina sp.]
MLIFILVLIQLSSVQLLAGLNYSQQSVVLLFHDIRLARIERQLDSYGAWFAWQLAQGKVQNAPLHSDYQIDAQWSDVDCTDSEQRCWLLDLRLRHTVIPLQRSTRFFYQRHVTDGGVAWQRLGE